MSTQAPRYSLLAGTGVACRLLNVASERMLAEAGLSSDLEAHQTVGVTAAEFHRAWNALVALASPDAPVVLGSALARGTFIPAMFALSCAPNLAEGLTRLAPYKSLIGPSAWRVEEDAERVCVVFEDLDPNAPMPASMALMQAVLVLESLRTCTGVHVVPKRINISDTAAASAYFGRAPEPGPQPMLVLDREDAYRAFISENEDLWRLFQHDLDDRLERLDRRRPLLDRVRTSLRKLLASGRGSLHDASEELGMSTRALQVALQREGSNFQTLLAEVRHELALRYLHSSTLENAEVSFLLGYQDPNSFYRAFRTWTGMTPSEARERMRASEP